MTRLSMLSKWAVLRLSCICVMVTLVLPVVALAQGVTGTLSGTVKDAQGGVIPGASVTVLNESQGTRSSPVITNESGDFVVPNLPSGSYSVTVEMSQFRTLNRPGVVVTSGSRVSVGTLVIEIGGANEMVTVTSEVPLVQTTSGERSFSVTTESVASLPVQNRSYFGLLALAPGVVPGDGNSVAIRLGGGGNNNYMIDGAVTMDPSINRPMAHVSVEAIEEVKVQTSSYAAEYGRASGLQVNAVTKSGTNVFRGSLYDVERDSKWNANNRANIIMGDPKTEQDERDWGFAIGGPVGKPGGNNKLFFYFNYERNPRLYGKDEINRYRMPTALERQGDFSQTRDNNGNLYPYIRDYQKAGACNATSQVACFADGGVLGRIPADRLYQPGLAVLKWYPMPNIPDAAGRAYNMDSVYPGVNLIGYEPVVRVDYQPTPNVRGTFKYLLYQQPAEPILGTVPGWNDALALDFGTYAPAAAFNWTVNPKTFVEASWGYNWHVQQGCGGIAGSAPDFCRAANASNPSGNKVLAGLGDLPWIYPDQWLPEPGAYWAEVFRELQKKGGTLWDGERVQSVPNFQWGNRIANPPPLRGERVPLASWTWTANLTVTRVAGSHTLKAGYFYYNSRHIRGVVVPDLNFGNDTANSFDTSFGYANAATGVFSSFFQDSRYAEGDFRANNREAFVQDNWKVSSNLTLDYGLRFVNMTPVYDFKGKTSNFLPDRWEAGKAPLVYQAGCSTGVYPCAAASRVARHPQTGELLGAGSALLVGSRVKGTGEALNGLFAAGQGIDDRLYVYPSLSLAPRVGAAWNMRGDNTVVARGGFGIFYDRSNTNQLYDSITNPPFDNRTTLRYGLLQTLQEVRASAPDPAVALWAMQYDQDLFSSVQWSGGVQFTVPFSMVVDAAYTGQQSANGLQTVNINNIDLGTAFLPQYQNPAAANPANMTDPATSYATTNPDVIRFYRGYGAISMRQARSERTYHSIQLSLNRRFSKGLAFGFYDTMGLSDRQTVAPRLQHNADGTVTLRADQAAAQELLGSQNPQDHLMRANFTWQLPNLTGGGSVLRALVNGWSLSGIWNGATGSYYSVSASYQSGGSNVNLTGSPDYGARVVVLPNVDLGGGCSSDPVHQFNTSAFRGPAVGSVGLESGNGYLKGCFISSVDLAIARRISAGKGYNVELRVDLFNAFNQAGITNRNTTMNLTSPSDPVTITNLPNEATSVRTKPVGAGFGVATTYQDPRSAQFHIRVSF